MSTIFDSKIAHQLALDENLEYYISEGFQVRPGEVAHVIMTASAEGFHYLRLYVHRTPQPLTRTNCVSALKGIYTRLHCHAANTGMGDPTIKGNRYSKNTVVLGKTAEAEFFDYITITRPGHYYLAGTKAENHQVEDCEHPTIIEVQIAPAQPTSRDGKHY